jgi:hypothetical protein
MAGPDIYWRRRLFALAAGLAVFGLLAWAVGGAATHPMAPTASISSKSPHTNPPPSTLPVTPTPSPSSSSPSPSPSPSGSSSARSHSKSKHKHTASSRRAGHGKTGRTALGDDCPTSDVVVSLTASRNSYPSAVRPKFTVTVVSTAGRRCAFNIGPRYLTLVIHSGSVRAWGSADCVHGSGTQVTMLRRGVPVQQKITWNRTLSARGCRPPHSAARPGTYTVAASDSGIRSRTLVFVLR